MRLLENISRDIAAQKLLIKQAESKLSLLYVEYEEAYKAIPKVTDL